MNNNRLIADESELEILEIYRQLTEYNKGYVIQFAAERLQKQVLKKHDWVQDEYPLKLKYNSDKIVNIESETSSNASNIININFD